MARRPGIRSGWRLRSTLVEHGLGEAAVDALVGGHMRPLVAATRRRKREHAILLDAVSGEQVGETLVGSRFQVDLGPHLRRPQPESSYVSAHTHPSDCSFSRIDALLLFLHPPIRCVVVLGAHGAVYLLSRLTAALPSPDQLVAAFRAAHQSHTPDYERVIAAGSASQRAAEYVRSHAVWRTIAAGCGLRYTRLEKEGAS